ncbi:hypothetical protein [Phycicoccus sp.]|uniref:hypothetical protein n=1 Tax=Phycicoccus sp. TaxID=1902410 RepID=UPI002C0BD5F3|nr:hypothetical protein [Phycicoccus sp.]HMM95197.1 hypothetical protein [Phycicoccus sp.]
MVLITPAVFVVAVALNIEYTDAATDRGHAEDHVELDVDRVKLMIASGTPTAEIVEVASGVNRVKVKRSRCQG